jgi:hypothetical protein
MKRKDRALQRLLSALNGTGDFAEQRFLPLRESLRARVDQFQKLDAIQCITIVERELHESDMELARMSMAHHIWQERHLKGERSPEVDILHRLATKQSLCDLEREVYTRFCLSFADVVRTCDRCGLWHANKVYCSRRCGKLALRYEQHATET